MFRAPLVSPCAIRSLTTADIPTFHPPLVLMPEVVSPRTICEFPHLAREIRIITRLVESR